MPADTTSPPSPADYQPPLRWWGHAWRLAAVLSISAVAWAPVVGNEPPSALTVNVVLGVLCLVAMHARRRLPVTVAVLTAAAAAFSALAAGPAVLTAVSVATRRRWPEVAVVAAVNVVSAEGYARIYPDAAPEPWWLTLALNVSFMVAFLAVGLYVGSRRELLHTLRERAKRAEAEQDLRAARARLEERERIAREMHDVLAHRLSQVAMRTSALGYRADLTADEMRAEVAVIDRASHQALTDLRDVLGVLRDHEGATSPPQPTYDDLADLVASARGAGQRLCFEEHLAPEAVVPQALGRTVYRIVQEGLTNARKHAPDAEVSLVLTGSPDEGMAVSLRNPLGVAAWSGRPAPPGSGLGLLGLAERAELGGGRLDHRREERQFVVEAWLPWPA